MDHLVKLVLSFCCGQFEVFFSVMSSRMQLLSLFYYYALSGLQHCVLRKEPLEGLVGSSFLWIVTGIRGKGLCFRHKSTPTPAEGQIQTSHQFSNYRNSFTFEISALSHKMGSFVSLLMNSPSHEPCLRYVFIHNFRCVIFCFGCSRSPSRNPN